MKVAFLGLGAMGRGMAQNLVAAGHDVVTWNRTARTIDGARPAASPAEAARGADAVMTMLADDTAVAETIAAAQVQPGQVHVSCSTISVGLARTLAQKQDLVSAPVFGRPEAAAARKLWVVAAGRSIARVRPLLGAIGQGVLVAGEDPPAANVVKIAGNFLIASVIEALGEAFSVAERNGVPRPKLLEMFAASLFKAPIQEGYATIIAGKKYRPAGFRAPLGLKDVKLAMQLGELPLAKLVAEHLAALPPDVDWAAAGDYDR